MRVAQKLWVFVFVCLLFAACSGKGDKFVGQWQGKDVMLTITKNGDSLELQSNGRPGEKFKASFQKDGTLTLIFPIQNIRQEFALTLSADGKTLYFMAQEFNRVGK